MRYIKFAVAGLIVLFILFTAIGLLMPSSVTVLRSVDIQAPADSVRYYTNDLSKWRHWINGADTTYYKQFTGSTIEKNSRIALGTYTITVIENDDKHILTSWESKNNREQLNRLELFYNSSAGTTMVNWSFKQQLNWYPWERITAMLHDKIFGPSMEASLNKLKQVCEK
ncbi:MAG TPA: SRPBCC family protein [Parafilimonas sp.]|nr:SRPBCC family protein [Parafilimonas sp.]